MNCDSLSKSMDHTIFCIKVSNVQINISWDIQSSLTVHKLITTRCNQTRPVVLDLNFPARLTIIIR